MGRGGFRFFFIKEERGNERWSKRGQGKGGGTDQSRDERWGRFLVNEEGKV